MLRSLYAWYRSYRQRVVRFVYYDVLHADDPPHRIALGLAIGMFVAFTPTVGAQMIIAGFLSWLLRANKAVSVAIVWISNPLTLIPMYWFCYRVGCFILREKPDPGWWAELGAPPDGWWPAVSFYWTRFLEIATPLWLGCLVVGVVSGYALYYPVYHGVRIYRQRHGILSSETAPP